MHLIDSHCHLDFADFDADRQQVLMHCTQLGVTDIVVPAVSRQHWSRVLQLCEQNPHIHAALGLHPMFMDEHQTADLTQLEALLKTQNVVAVGEIGLDFYHGNEDKQAQLCLFEKQIELAQQYELPVILHVRKAHDEVLKVLRKAGLKGGVVHAFSGSEQQAAQYLKLGFKLGIGGALTYDRAHKLQRLFTELPLSAIVLETDSPDMPLMGKQGQRNSPENIPLILNKLAELRQVEPDLLAAATTDNCKQLFGIS